MTATSAASPDATGRAQALRKQDWAQALSVTAALGAVGSALRRRWGWGAGLLVTAVVADGAGRVWSRRDPRPLPASLRWVLRVPHPSGTLRKALDPQPGERFLELGPGLGHHAVDVATWIGRDGTLHVLDVQAVMLEETMRRAGHRGLVNVTPVLADATGTLPFPDGAFDAAYLVGVLGEIPDRARALSELHRVLDIRGRLVVGEIAGDPDFVPFGLLCRLAEAAGFHLDRRFGPPFAYAARFLAG